jgi:hypothetical protein
MPGFYLYKQSKRQQLLSGWPIEKEEAEGHNGALGMLLFEGLPAWLGPYFTSSRDEETRRKCALLALTMMLFILYNTILVASGVVSEERFFTFMRTVANLLVVSQSALLYIFHRTHRLWAIGGLFIIDADLGTLAVCFNYGAVAEYMMWVLYVPILLFYICGSRPGLYGLLFIIGQLTLFFSLSNYGIQPKDEEQADGRAQVVRDADDLPHRRRDGLRPRDLSK